MPIRNFWSLECGEVITAEALTKNVKDCEIYFPLHDTGIDLLAVKDKKHVSIQVKESRYFVKNYKGSTGSSSHQIHKKKFLRDRNRVDFYVFLTYIPQFGKHKMSSFENKFVIVSTGELAPRIENKKSGKRDVYSFYFNFDGNKITEKRDTLTEYSEYLDRMGFNR